MTKVHFGRAEFHLLYTNQAINPPIKIKVGMGR
jgi:hypothetical protein